MHDFTIVYKSSGRIEVQGIIGNQGEARQAVRVLQMMSEMLELDTNTANDANKWFAYASGMRLMQAQSDELLREMHTRLTAAQERNTVLETEAKQIEQAERNRLYQIALDMGESRATVVIQGFLQRNGGLSVPAENSGILHSEE